MTPPTQNSPQPTLWFYADKENNPVGPIELAELHRLATAGAINAETFIISTVSSEWQKYESINKVTSPTLPATDKAPNDSRMPVILGILLCFPVGLILLWLNKGYSQREKLILTIPSSLILAIGVLFQLPQFIILGGFFSAIACVCLSRRLSLILKTALASALVLFAISVMIATREPEPVKLEASSGPSRPVKRREIDPKQAEANRLALQRNRAIAEDREAVEAVAKKLFGRNLTKVEVNPILDGSQDGEYTVEIRFVAHSSQKILIDEEMIQAYEKIFTTFPNVWEVYLAASAKTVDSFGQESTDIVYKTALTAPVAEKINWADKNAVNFPAIWETRWIHRGLD